MKWFIEEYGQESIQPLIESVKKSGSEAIIGRKCIFDNFDDILNLEECIVYYGSLEFAREVQRKAKWIPGVYCDFDKFKCSYYYPRTNNLLNEHHCFMPYGELVSKKEWLYEQFGNSDCIFVRPDSGAKSFTGQVLYKDDFDKDVTRLGFYDVQPEEMCVIAEPQNIHSEYRFFVVDGAVIAGSMYKWGGALHTSVVEPNTPQWEAAQRLCVGITLERAFAIDIALMNDLSHINDRGQFTLYKILELNSFSCSGMYDCQTDPIVAEINRIAKEEYESYQR